MYGMAWHGMGIEGGTMSTCARKEMGSFGCVSCVCMCVYIHRFIHKRCEREAGLVQSLLDNLEISSSGAFN